MTHSYVAGTTNWMRDINDNKDMIESSSSSESLK